jgi:DNA-binding PadR family transcriptional regulator
MRRKQGMLLPIEIAICRAAIDLRRRATDEFHGYEIARYLGEVGDRKLLTAYGTLYRALGRLEEMGLLKSRGEDPRVAARENRPRRRFYTITASGELAARAAADGTSPGEAVRRWKRRPATA